MKLAEALSIRADLQRHIRQLKNRLKDSSKVQEGDTPAEDTQTLFHELDDSLGQLEELVYRINRTNMQTLCEGETLTRLIARKDTLTLRITAMRELLRHVTDNDRYARNEIRYVRTIDVAALRKKTDDYSRQLRELDLKLQGLNWSTNLI